MARVRLRAEEIRDPKSFHTECVRALGFFDGYGHNMDAWIDCMSSLREADSIVGVHLSPDEVLQLEIPDMIGLRARVPEVFQDLVDCAAFVNLRYERDGQLPPVALVFC